MAKRRKKPQPRDMKHWLNRCQALIAKHSTQPRVAGKYKGHASTDAGAWIAELAYEVVKEIRRTNPGIAYDENMALASKLGLILVAWYANVHRAKTYDIQRPLDTRRLAADQLALYRRNVISMMMNDELMCEVFGGQVFNLPYGIQAAGGTYT
jgi:hypothetical protein